MSCPGGSSPRHLASHLPVVDLIYEIVTVADQGGRYTLCAGSSSLPSVFGEQGGHTSLNTTTPGIALCTWHRRSPVSLDSHLLPLAHSLQRRTLRPRGLCWLPLGQHRPGLQAPGPSAEPRLAPLADEACLSGAQAYLALTTSNENFLTITSLFGLSRQNPGPHRAPG